MRKILSAAAASLAAAMMLTACGANSTTTSSSANGSEGAWTVELTKVVVGASPVPHARILEFVRDNLAAGAGIEVEIKEFDDYVLPNEALAAGELDANYFQHLPYLEEQMREKGYQFEHSDEGVHVEPYAAFSSKYDNIEDLPDGATIAITSDVSNQVRGLRLLEEAGLLKDIADDSAALTLTDEQNPKGFKFVEDQPELIVQQIEDPAIDLAFVNGNFILTADRNAEQVLIEKGENNPYTNFLVWRSDNTNEGVAKLDELLHSDEVRSFIKETWPAGEVIASK